MKLIGHIVKKDFRELSGTVAIYTLFIAAKLVLGALLVHGAAADPAMFSRIQSYGNLCLGLEVLTGYVLVAAWVHEHPLIGTRAEWMTRPISGGQLLAAKLCGLGLVMAVLPLALALPWWLGNGYGVHEIERAAAETLLRQAVVVVPALALAVLTDGFDRYVIWLLVLFGLGFGASMLPPVRAAMSTPDVAVTREWLSLAVAAATALFVVANQFFTRRTGRGVALLCFGLGGTALAAWWWPHDLTRFARRTAEATWESVPADQITLVLERARVIRRPNREPELRVAMAVRGVPPDLKLHGGRAAQTWEWGGVKIERPGELHIENFGTVAPVLRALGLRVPQMDPAWFQANAERPLRAGLLGQLIPPEGVGLSVQTPMRPAYLARMQHEPADYDLAVSLELFRPEVIGEEPLRTGGRIDRGRDHVRIARLEQVGSALRVTLVESGPAVSWKSPGRYVGTGFAGEGPEVEYFLTNRARGNASRGQELLAQRARFGTVAITWRVLEFRAPREWIGGAWVELQGWDQNLTLAKVANRRVAEVPCALQVESLPLTEDK